jgi:hypothetical protein
MNLPVAYHGNPAGVRLDGDATALAAGEGSIEDQDRGAEIAELFDLDPEIGPSRLDVGKKLPQSIAAAIDLALGPPTMLGRTSMSGWATSTAASMASLWYASNNRRTTSTFSCDIARPSIPPRHLQRRNLARGKGRESGNPSPALRRLFEPRARAE